MRRRIPSIPRNHRRHQHLLFAVSAVPLSASEIGRLDLRILRIRQFHLDHDGRIVVKPRREHRRLVDRPMVVILHCRMGSLRRNTRQMAFRVTGC